MTLPETLSALNRVGLTAEYKRMFEDSRLTGIFDRETLQKVARGNAAEPCGDRVSDNIFDVRDERADVDIIAHRRIHGANWVPSSACAPIGQRRSL